MWCQIIAQLRKVSLLLAEKQKSKKGPEMFPVTSKLAVKYATDAAIPVSTPAIANVHVA